MTKKEMQELLKSIDSLRQEWEVLKAHRKDLMKEINNMAKALDKIKNMI